MCYLHCFSYLVRVDVQVRTVHMSMLLTSAGLSACITSPLHLVMLGGYNRMWPLLDCEPHRRQMAVVVAGGGGLEQQTRRFQPDTHVSGAASHSHSQHRTQ
jgi:hypothetical protein